MGKSKFIQLKSGSRVTMKKASYSFLTNWTQTRNYWYVLLRCDSSWRSHISVCKFFQSFYIFPFAPCWLHFGCTYFIHILTCKLFHAIYLFKTVLAFFDSWKFLLLKIFRLPIIVSDWQSFFKSGWEISIFGDIHLIFFASQKRRYFFVIRSYSCFVQNNSP